MDSPLEQNSSVFDSIVNEVEENTERSKCLTALAEVRRTLQPEDWPKLPEVYEDYTRYLEAAFKCVSLGIPLYKYKLGDVIKKREHSPVIKQFAYRRKNEKREWGEGYHMLCHFRGMQPWFIVTDFYPEERLQNDEEGVCYLYIETKKGIFLLCSIIDYSKLCSDLPGEVSEFGNEFHI